MKTILAAILMVLFLPLVASAQFSGTEVETWVWDEDGSAWVYQGTGDVTALARCWASLPTQGACNKDWNIDVDIHASIAQWIEWTLSGSRWDWKVRKPGRYGADCITASVKSNQHVLVDYHNFNDLETESVSVNPTIPIWYHVSELGAQLPPPDSPLWTRAADLNNSAEWDTIYDSQQLHDGIQFKLWNMIEVVDCNSACEYHDDAEISLKLLCQKWWIDRSTGYFIDNDGN
jgi:hypothetical protein